LYFFTAQPSESNIVSATIKELENFPAFIEKLEKDFRFWGVGGGGGGEAEGWGGGHRRVCTLLGGWLL
jgi:hypothetical protein